jgi:NAD dependent epimerase/dehydratase family enzyme
MKVVVSGASGMVGSALVPRLREDGHEVLQLVRREPRRAHEVRWDPSSGHLDPADLEGVEAAIGLSGAGPGDRHWTPARKRVLRDSRVDPTLTLAHALAALDPMPKTLLVASRRGGTATAATRR